MNTEPNTDILDGLFSNNYSMVEHRDYPGLGGINLRSNNSNNNLDDDADLYNEPGHYNSQDNINEFEGKSKDDIRKSITVNGLSGFRNIGNTCYMNSVLQCLSAVDSLRSYMIDTETTYFHESLELRQKKILADKIRKEKNLEKDAKVVIKRSDLNRRCESTMSFQLKNIFERMWNTNKTIVPTSFKNLIGRFNSQFLGHNQNDSHELLVLVLDKIHEDLQHNKQQSLKFCNTSDEFIKYTQLTKEYVNKIKSSNLTPAEITEIKLKINEIKNMYKKEKFLMAAQVFWTNNIAKEYSIIRRLFTGISCTEINCKECNNTYISFQIFTTLTLSIPENKRNLSLTDCLKHYSASDILNGSNQYRCENCNKKTDATKTDYIWRPPKVLVIHFNRFKHTGRGIRKIDTNISYPLANMKLDECYSKFNKHDITYELIAVNKHIGSYHGGHYTACRRNSLNNKWYDCNDSTISYIPSNQVLNSVVNSQGYMLFYKMA